MFKLFLRIWHIASDYSANIRKKRKRITPCMSMSDKGAIRPDIFAGKKAYFSSEGNLFFLRTKLTFPSKGIIISSEGNLKAIRGKSATISSGQKTLSTQEQRNERPKRNTVVLVIPFNSQSRLTVVPYRLAIAPSVSPD